MEKSSVFIITGSQGAGKTTKVMEVVRYLKKELPDVFGFYAIGEWENGRRSRFRIVDIQTGIDYPLCNRHQPAGAAKGKFIFTAETVKQGEEIIASGIRRKGTLAVIDEIGRFELKEKVWYSAFHNLIKKNFPVLITVRENQLEAITAKFNLDRPLIFKLDEESLLISKTITSRLEKRKSQDIREL